MYTTAEDWLDRFTAAGCSLKIDEGGNMSPRETNPPSECVALWSELQGPENLDKWKEVGALVEATVGPIFGWGSFPPSG